jgi:CheY-like chemotaxis protein
MTEKPSNRSIQILLVEDNPGDVVLVREALKRGNIRNDLHVVSDGVKAMSYLRRQDDYADAGRPDLVLLDLNLPRKNGLEVLQEIKSDPELQGIPVVILSGSKSEEDILKAYQLHANCFITKPGDYTSFLGAIASIGHFWGDIVKLPARQ